MLSMKFLFLATFNIFVVWGKKWHEIDVYKSEVVPNFVRIFERTPVIAYCGSSVPVNWTYQNLGSTAKINLTPVPHGVNIPFLYQLSGTKISLYSLTKDDSGIFHCHGRYGNEAMESFQFTGSMLMFVLDKTDQLPYHTIVPNYVEVFEGDTVTLRCRSDLPVEWFYRRDLIKNSITGSNSFTLINLEKEHSGVYICLGVYNNVIDIDEPVPFHSRARIVVDSSILYHPRDRKHPLPERENFF